MTTSSERALKGLIFGAILCGCTIFASGCSHSAASGSTTITPTSSTVATVNGEPIEQKELDQELNRLHGPDVLQSLIDDRLIAQEANKNKIAVDDNEVQSQFNDIKNTPQYNAMLKAKNMTDADVQKYIRRVLQLKKLILLEIPEQEKLKMYDQYREQLEEAHIYDILVDKKEDADKIVEQLKSGKDFEQMARENSKDEASKERGGDLGWVPHSAPFDPAFGKVAFSAPLNQIEGPVQTRGGFAILKVTGRKKTYDELKSDIEDRLVGARQGEYMERLRVKADIKTKFDQALAKRPAVGAPGANVGGPRSDMGAPPAGGGLPAGGPPTSSSSGK